MRTQDEIVEHIRANEGLLDFTASALVPYLDFEHAKPWLKEDVTADQWKPTPLDRETVLAEMREYMEFAWGKVEDHRGISASRSVDKMGAWVWLLGDDEVLADFKATGYPNYGAPKLAVVCRAYGFPIPDDEGVQRMIQGDDCGIGDCGCGR